MPLVQCVALDTGTGATSLVCNAGAGWASTSAGNTLIVLLSYTSGQPAASSPITDSATQTWVEDVPYGGTIRNAAYHFAGTAAGVTSVTLSNTAADKVTAFFIEWSNIVTASNPFDKKAEAVSGAGSGTFDSTAVATTAQSSEIAFGQAHSRDNDPVTYTPTGSGSWSPITGTGVTSGQHRNAPDGGDNTYVGYQELVAVGTPNFQGTNTLTATNSALIVTYKLQVSLTRGLTTLGVG
jgi:hypothetical protein